MKLEIQELPELGETEVIIRCRRMDAEVARLAAQLQGSDARLVGLLHGESHVLDPAQVLYIDTADRATFLYTAGQVYETGLRLYELEERLAGREFLRVSKSAILNFDHVRSLRPDLGGRLRLTLSNGEVIVVNRQYAPAIKAKLGIGKEKLS